MLGATNEVLIATSMRDGRVFLKDNPDINLVVLDGIVPMYTNERPEKTLDIAHELEWRYPQIIVVAASSDENINKELLDCGAHYAIPDKSIAALQEILKKLPPTTK
jgi:hypothetical protein